MAPSHIVAVMPTLPLKRSSIDMTVAVTIYMEAKLGHVTTRYNTKFFARLRIYVFIFARGPTHICTDNTGTNIIFPTRTLSPNSLD